MVSWQPQEFMYLQQEDKWFRLQFNYSTVQLLMRFIAITQLTSNWNPVQSKKD
jgi:hypothetical protein